MTTLSAPDSEVDADVTRRVAMFLNQRHVVLPQNLSISAQRGVVTIRGLASTFHQRQLLVSATQRVAGVVQVIDNLEVAPSVALKQQTHASPRALLAASAVVFLAALLVAGCGRSGPPRFATQPAKGSVTFQGQPADGAFLAFHPKSETLPAAPTSTAVVQPDGSFTISTYDSADGVPVGDYVVTVQWRKVVKAGGEYVPGPSLVPAKYGRPETSPVVVHVAAGQNNLSPIYLSR
jgi:hypothetical protein